VTVRNAHSKPQKWPEQHDNKQHKKQAMVNHRDQLHCPKNTILY